MDLGITDKTKSLITSPPRNWKNLSSLLKGFLKTIENYARKLRLRHERMILRAAVRIEDLHMIRRYTKARILLRDIVRDDKVEVLLCKFPACIFRDVLRLCRKADENLMLLFLSELIEDVGVARERQRQFAVRFCVLPSLRGDSLRPLPP